MADSQKLDVLKRLTTHLEFITGTFDITEEDDPVPYALAGAVFRGRTLFGDDSPTTMLSILEAPQGSFTIYGGRGEARKDTWLVLLQGWCPDDKVNPADPVYTLADAVEKRLARIMQTNSQGEAMYPLEFRLSNTIADLNFGPGVVRPPEAGASSKAFFYLPLQIVLASDVR